MSISKRTLSAFIFKGLVILSSLSFALYLAADDSLKIGIMQDKRGMAEHFAPLIKYFDTKGVKVQLIGFNSYRNAAEKFRDGKIDAMFAGSGVAGTMILKGLAYPLVRPVSVGGWSTYWAVVLVPKSNNDFKMTPKYWSSKKIICSALASSGEFFCRAFLGKNTKLLIAGNHGNAISALAKGVADIAVVKNRVWDAVKARYPDLKKVAEDHGKNPNNTLIVSSKIDKNLADKVKKILLSLKNDNSPEAESLKKALKITGYIVTTKHDFSHTIPLIKHAGVDKNYDFGD